MESEGCSDEEVERSAPVWITGNRDHEDEGDDAQFAAGYTPAGGGYEEEDEESEEEGVHVPAVVAGGCQRRSAPPRCTAHGGLPVQHSSPPRPSLRFPARPEHGAPAPSPPAAATLPAASPDRSATPKHRRAHAGTAVQRSAALRSFTAGRRMERAAGHMWGVRGVEVPATVKALRSKPAFQPADRAELSEVPDRARRIAFRRKSADQPPDEQPAEKPAERVAAAEQRLAGAADSTAGSRRCAARARRRRKKLREPRVRVYMNTAAAKPVVLVSASQMKVEFVPLREYAQLLWVDRSVSVDTAKTLVGDKQRINKIPGMRDLCSKVLMTHHLNRMRALFPDGFQYYPQTFCIPGDEEKVQEHVRKRRKRREGGRSYPDRPTWIVKPSKGLQGAGIFLTQTLAEVDLSGRSEVSYVVQKYIDNPLLIDGLKFDLRLYVIVLGSDPMRVYLARDGLARFATTKYSAVTPSTIGDAFMHLTNYSLNKDSENFVPNTDAARDDRGSKRSLRSVLRWLASEGHDTEALWERIQDLVVQTMLALHPSILLNVESIKGPGDGNDKCFHILGADVMLDADMKPWLLELNAGPSLECDSPLDVKVKEFVVAAALGLGTYGLASGQTSSKRAAFEEAWFAEGLDLVHPTPRTAAVYSHLHHFNREMRSCFDAACGVKRGDMSAGRFCKFFRDCGIVRSYRQMTDAKGSRSPQQRPPAAEEADPQPEAAPAPPPKVSVRETKACMLRRAVCTGSTVQQRSATCGPPSVRPRVAQQPRRIDPPDLSFGLRVPSGLADRVQTLPQPEIELLFLKRARCKSSASSASNPGGEHSSSGTSLNFFEFLKILLDMAAATFSAEEFSSFTLLEKLRMLVTPARAAAAFTHGMVAAAPAKG
eukprot:TRINITY_DN3969_c0_g1_i2.p1 TRINITY_DN3969_c0_g1~~TRINITY_DN3969_c0_g1_i2.p1  ORF type:complete len:882 (+),score=279.24 TRINITY_DN3969_c0_g1_i2:75-2720(+)